MDSLWTGRLIENATLADVAAVVPDYEAMLLSILELVLERHEQQRNYPYIDTKVSILTGRDFPSPSDPESDFKTSDAIFGWIQGRGLEALAGHAEWLPMVSGLSQGERDRYHERIARMAATVVDRMEEVRLRCHGRVGFLMNREGQPFDAGPDGRRRYITLDPHTTSGADLFYAKGLMAAARLLGRTDQLQLAFQLLRRATTNIETGRHHTDQVSFDPNNQIPSDPGRQAYAWHMIAILGHAEAARFSGEEEWFRSGERLIRHVLSRHINVGQWPELHPFDFVEAIDAWGRPWGANGEILCDPGHALEFIGIATKFLLLLQQWPHRSRGQDELLSQCRELLPLVLLREFEIGSRAELRGICKAIDLVTLRAINSEMPWWSLPETMRAAAELLVLDPGSSTRDEMLRVIRQCSNAFVKFYVNREFHLMAFQTVGPGGKPIDVIPATPDADPGYHTGLSIIGFIACVRRLIQAQSPASENNSALMRA